MIGLLISITIYLVTRSILNIIWRLLYIIGHFISNTIYLATTDSIYTRHTVVPVKSSVSSIVANLFLETLHLIHVILIILVVVISSWWIMAKLSEESKRTDQGFLLDVFLDQDVASFKEIVFCGAFLCTVHLVKKASVYISSKRKK